MKISILQVISTCLLLEAAALPKDITDPTTVEVLSVETPSASLSSTTIVVAVTPSPASSADTIVSVETPSTPSSTGTTVAVDTSSALSLTGIIVSVETPSASSPTGTTVSVETPSAPLSSTTIVVAVTPSTTPTTLSTVAAETPSPPATTILTTITAPVPPPPTTIYTTVTAPPTIKAGLPDLVTEGDPRWLTNYAGKPTYDCWYREFHFHNNFYLVGTNWNTTEGEIKNLCRKADAMTGWDWYEYNNTSGMQTFRAHFSLALLTAERLEKNLNKFVKPWAYHFSDLEKIKCSSKGGRPI